ncbi:MAG: CDP-glycerol glycerophosphotransferase [Bacteroidota bacterium]|nr:CDP-glycerol glycerophosphotransferase [Bacteroidota bacterium]
MRFRFLIYFSDSYAIPIGKPLQTEILKQGYEIKWFCDLEYPKSLFPENGELIPDVEKLFDYDPHIILCASNHAPDFIPGLKVQIFHGFKANKRDDKVGHFRIRNFFDLYCTQGPSTTKPFKKLAEKYKTFYVRETGWSKVDPIFHIPEEKRSKPTILVSSTFSPRYSFTYHSDVLKEIEKLSNEKEWKWLVILHPKMAEDRVEAIKNLENDNLKFIETTDIIPLFRKADIMFADTTSAITEFLLQKKPVVTFRNNRPEEHLLNVEKSENIEEALKLAFTRPPELLQKIDDYLQITHPYFDGESSKRVIETCIEILKKDKSDLKNKPLNLIRKFKLRKKLNYFSLRSYNKPYTLKS